VFFGGAGLILYGACWLLVPDDGSDHAAINLDERSRTVALAVAFVLGALALIGDSWGAFGFPWPLAIIALLALWLLTRNRPPAGSAPAAPPPYGPQQGQPYGQGYPQPYAPPYTPPYGPPQDNTYATAPPPPAAPQTPPQTAPQTPPQAPPPAYTYTPARTPNPRKRGPILFWFTLALIVLGEGVLGIVDAAGASVAASAYPALAVGISGLMLLVGAFFGRAGGIILLGLLSSVALVIGTAADRWDGETVYEQPTRAATVDDRYWNGVGEQIVDLRSVADVEELDGRTIDVEGGVGRLEVIVPDDLDVTVHADVDGPGNIELFDSERGGIDISMNATDAGSTDNPDNPEITIDAQLGVGQIEVHR
jgi:Cell wall-active antibiotics response 4TMS YvqF